LFLQKSNNISREEIIGILKRNNTKDEKTFTIMTMLKYNFDLEPTDVRNFLLNSNNSEGDDYLSVVKDVDEIVWNRTISMFQDLNNLIIIFYENEKIKMHQQQKSENGKTKRIYLSSNASLSSHSKTLKKKLKTT
jgi:Mg2+/Co2+ transporter CorB